jgi:disulfide bond formation protein DsbB
MLVNNIMTRLSIAWIVAIIATLGSLYFSEIAGFIPCNLCWYQRILMYPLVVILGVGYYKGDSSVKHYALPLSIIGIIVSSTHYLHQKTNLFDRIVRCTEGVPCSGQYINWFNFITIPLLAFVAFTVITICLVFKENDVKAK